MGIKFANGGFLTTIQDRGREGYQEFGVSVSGAMDRRSLALANLLVGNDEYEAAVEVTLMGPVMEFTSENIIAVTGGDLGAKLNGKPLSMYEAVAVKAKDVLSFSGMKSGSRGYVAFAGGLDVPLVMGSKSTNMKSKLGGYEGRKLGAGDLIEFAAPKTTLPNMGKRRVEPDDFSSMDITLRVLMGPQDDCFTEKGIGTFLSSTYSVTNESDRMGCRLEGEVIEHKNGGDIITDGIAFGAVQVPTHGQPIIMMADRQTTGGYTKIANVISVDLPKMAQTRPGCKIKFKKVTIEEAQRLYLDELNWYKQLKDQLSREEVQPELKEDQVAEILTAVIASAQDCKPELSSGGKAVYYTKPVKYKIVIDGKEYEVELRQQVRGLR